MIRLIKIFVFTLIFFSCKKVDNKTVINSGEKLEKITVSDSIFENSKTSILQKTDVLDINGTWRCYKYTSNSSFKKEYDEDYAQEISKYSKFTIKNNILSVANCTKNIYTYKYATKLKKYEDESIFITEFKPQKDSVNFIGVVNSTNDINCEIIDNFTFFISDNNELVLFDRGYYFYYKKDILLNKDENMEIYGIPGNNRNEWKVKLKSNRSTSLENEYEFFLNEFTYGTKNLLKKFPNSDEFLDKINGIKYSRKSNELKILKDDPNGKILISFIQNEQYIEIIYELQYPEY